ncbi:MAG: hypothetical protein L0323_11215 [Planctomycetes bacterium]|nr:hypothetical protein [Planctomycetota bacterium]
MDPAEASGGLRGAIAAASASAFVAGLAAGAFLAGFPSPPEEEGPFPDYERRFARAFDPTPEQLLHLRYLLRKAREREEEIRSRFVASPIVEKDLRTLGAELEASVREDILTPRQRQSYEALLAAGEGSGAR